MNSLEREIKEDIAKAYDIFRSLVVVADIFTVIAGVLFSIGPRHLNPILVVSVSIGCLVTTFILLVLADIEADDWLPVCSKKVNRVAEGVGLDVLIWSVGVAVALFAAPSFLWVTFILWSVVFILHGVTLYESRYLGSKT